MTSYFSGFYPAETADGAKGSAAFAGATNIAILQLYKRSATTLGDSDKPNGVVTYTFATAVSDLSTITNGWTSTIPPGTDPLYVVGATAASSEPTDTIAINEWSTPVILVQNGSGGLNTATVFLFKRGNTSTLPAVPTQTVTYTFATGTALGVSSTGNTVSPYLDGWSQTAPDSAGNKYLFMITGTAISTGSSDSILTTEWSTVRIMAQDGAVGYTGYLTNESHTLPASPTGVVSAYTGASGDFKIFLDGVGDISSSFTLSTVSNPQTLTVVYTGSAYTISGGFDPGEDTAVITIRARGSGVYSGVILDKVFSLGKSKSGVDGSSPKLLAISTSRQLISYNAVGALSPATQTTTLTANKQNTTATVNWTIQDSIGNVLTPATYLSATTGDSITMTAANFQAAISVNASEGVTIIGTLTDGITLSDRVTVMKVKAGADGTNGVDGLNSATVFLYQRATSAPAVPSVDSTYTFSTRVLAGTLGSWSQTIPAGTNPIYVISATAVSTTATDIIPTAEWSLPSVLAQNGTNGNNGINAATVFLYQRATSAPAVPSVDSTYTFSSGILTGTLGSWTQTVPAGTNPIYVISATASSTAATDIIPTTEWAAPSVLAQNGTNGSNGLNNAIAYLYQRAASTPTAPGGTFTYTFSTGVLSGGTPGSWSQTITAGSNPLYVIAATASSSTTTDSIPAAEFSAPVIFTENGTNGSNGLNNAVVYLYQRAASSPAAPGGTFTYTFSSALLSGGTPGSWTQTIPATNGNPLWVIAATASSSTNTDSIPATEFSAPVTLVQDGSGGVGATSALLTRESQSLFAYADGTVVSFASANGNLKIYSGNTDVTNSATAFTATASGCTGTINTADNVPVNGQAKGYYQITAMSADTATLTLSATYSGTTFTKIYTITKTRGGYEIVATLPLTNLFAGRVVFLTTDNKLYRYTGAAWITSVPSTDISGTLTNAQIDALAASKITGQLSDSQIAAIASTKISGQLTNDQLAAIAAAKITGQLVSSQITDAAITAAKFAGGLEPITVVTSVPLTKSTNSIFNTTDSKLYRWNGAAYIASVPSTDISGTLTNAQIEALAASKITGQLSDSQIAGISAAKLTSQITTTQITDGAISTAKIAAGSITAGQIAADTITAGNIAAGAITASEISAGAVTAGKIAAGSIVSGDIAADTITADNIAANAITANELAANAVTAGKIAAGSITSTQIAADTITAGNIAAGAVTASEIAAGSITSAQIAADTITAGNIAANAITASEISAGAVIAGKIAADAVTANEIAANAITASEISAGAVSAGKLAAGAVTAGTIAAGAVTAGTVAANAITANEIASNAITSDEISAGAITAAKISVTQLSSISATIGTLRTATTGERTEISDNVIKVFDGGNVVRVKIGNLAL